MNPPSELPPVMLWMREKRLQDLIENPLYSHQRTNLEKVLRMFQSGEIAPLWADHQLYFCNGELVGSELPADTRSLPGPVWHEPECGLAHEAAAYEHARQANVAPQVGTGDNQSGFRCADCVMRCTDVSQDIMRREVITIPEVVVMVVTRITSVVEATGLRWFTLGVVPVIVTRMLMLQRAISEMEYVH